MADQSIPAWQVTQQVEATELDPSGAYVRGVTITFRTAAGAVGSVFVPRDAYAVERVRAMVAERAAIVDAIAGLTG